MSEATYRPCMPPALDIIDEMGGRNRLKAENVVLRDPESGAVRGHKQVTDWCYHVPPHMD